MDIPQPSAHMRLGSESSDINSEVYNKSPYRPYNLNSSYQSSSPVPSASQESSTNSSSYDQDPFKKAQIVLSNHNHLNSFYQNSGAVSLGSQDSFINSSG